MWTQCLCFHLLQGKKSGKTTTKMQHQITITQSTTLTGAGLDVEISLPFINRLLILVIGPYEPFPNSYEVFIHQASRKQLQQQLLVTSSSVIKRSLWRQWLWGIRQLNFNQIEINICRFWVSLFVFPHQSQKIPVPSHDAVNDAELHACIFPSPLPQSFPLCATLFADWALILFFTLLFLNKGRSLVLILFYSVFQILEDKEYAFPYFWHVNGII